MPFFRPRLFSLRCISQSVPYPVTNFQLRELSKRSLNVNFMPPSQETRPPYPPFTHESAVKKVKAAQDAWNTRDPAQVKLAYTPDSIWRNRSTFLQGREAIDEFLTKKWAVEHGYRLRKELFSFTENKIAVQFWYEWYSTDPSTEKRQWFRTYGLEDWTFASNGLMEKRQMSGNDVAISDEERWFRNGVDVNGVDIGPAHW